MKTHTHMNLCINQTNLMIWEGDGSSVRPFENIRWKTKQLLWFRPKERKESQRHEKISKMYPLQQKMVDGSFIADEKEEGEQAFLKRNKKFFPSGMWRWKPHLNSSVSQRWNVYRPHQRDRIRSSSQCAYTNKTHAYKKNIGNFALIFTAELIPNRFDSGRVSSPLYWRGEKN